MHCNKLKRQLTRCDLNVFFITKRQEMRQSPARGSVTEVAEMGELTSGGGEAHRANSLSNVTQDYLRNKKLLGPLMEDGDGRFLRRPLTQCHCLWLPGG